MATTPDEMMSAVSASLAERTGKTLGATHKIALRSVDDVDDQVRHLLRLACEQNP